MRIRLLLLAAVVLCACAPRDANRVVNVKDFGGGDEGPASTCTDDAREEDDQIAYVLGKATKEGEKFDAMSCPGDEDFSYLVAQGRLFVKVTWSAGDGDLRVDVLDTRGAMVGFDRGTDVADRGEGRAHLQRIGATGDYYLRIRNRAGTPVKYRVELVPVGDGK